MTAVVQGSVDSAPVLPRGWSLSAAAARLSTVLLVAAAGVSALRPVGDPDIFWHLRTGELILDTHRLPSHDSWSATGPSLPWVPHEWLGELFFTAAYSVGGFAGVAVARCLLVVLLVGSIGWLATRRLPPWLAVLVTAATVLGTSAGWGERPQLLSFLLLVPASGYVRRAVAGEVRGWWLVPLTWLWSMVHGLWFLPLLLLAVTGLVAAAERRDLRLFGRLALVGGASLAAVLALTPAGVDLLRAVVAVGDTSRYVSEWSPLNVRTAHGVGFLTMLLVVLALLVRSGRRLPWWVLADVSVAVVLGVTWSRTTAPATILLATLACRLGADLTRGPVPVARIVSAASVIGAALSLTLAAVVAAPGLGAADDGYPARAAAYLQDQPAGTVVLNAYRVGGYLLWAAPHARPVVDQRIEIFPPDLLAAYMQALSLRGDWRGLVRRTGARLALVARNEPLSTGLRDVLGWRTILTDGDYVLLQAP